VAAAYHGRDADEAFTADGWFRTGDIVTIGPNAELIIQDRCKDLVKSGGEWISSVLLENCLMGHPSVADAAVIAVPHAQWVERPLAVVVLRADCRADAEELRSFLAESFAKWWVPDAVVFAESLPRTATGKVRKLDLRALHGEHYSAVSRAAT
jgi:fatty-acyl-CoA synthase